MNIEVTGYDEKRDVHPMRRDANGNYQGAAVGPITYSICVKGPSGIEYICTCPRELVYELFPSEPSPSKETFVETTVKSLQG
jgi:hypothetical protein